jgi:hypothetical protein
MRPNPGEPAAQLTSTHVAFTWVFEEVTTNVPTNDGLVQGMVPGPGTVIDEEDQVVVTVWRYSP